MFMNSTLSDSVSLDRMDKMRFKVLVADDSAADQLLAQSRLGRSCCLELVATVSTGENVIEYLRGDGRYSNRLASPFPDLLLLDVDMPGLNGFQVLKWTKTQYYPHLRIVMLSGNDNAL